MNADTPAPFDLLVRRPHSPVCLPLEVKAPGGKLTHAQEAYFAECPYLVVMTIEAAYEACRRWL